MNTPDTRPMGTAIRALLVALTLIAGPMTGSATAQSHPGFAVDLTAGWVGFADDGIVSEGLIGGAARWYVLRRVSIGPEIIYIRGGDHSHLVVTGNATWDLLASTDGRPLRVTPFLVAGGGVFQTRESFPAGRYSSSEGAFTAGGGVRVAAGNRVTIGIDARVGWELHVRVSGLVGLRLGR